MSDGTLSDETLRDRTISGREARIYLQRRAGVTDRQARAVLAAGLAGVPRHRGTAHLFDEHRLARLVQRPTVTYADLRRRCPAGSFVARRSDGAILRTRPEQLAALRRGWETMSIWTRIALRVSLDQGGSLPFLATVAGFVYLGANLVDVAPGARLVLADADSWFDDLRGTRVPTGPGRPWLLDLPTQRRRAAA